MSTLMSPKKPASHVQPKPRADHDRRQQDDGPPPGWRDRRHSVERRLPEVEEDAVSKGEWEVYFAAYAASRQPTAEVEDPPPPPETPPRK